MSDSEIADERGGDGGRGDHQVSYWGGTPTEPDLGPHRAEEQYDDDMLPGEDDLGGDMPVTFGDTDEEE